MRIELLNALDSARERYRPSQGAFVVLLGEIANFTDQNGCINGDDFRLVNDFNYSTMERSWLDAAKQKYGFDYPGFILGQCLDYDQIENTLLVFDVDPNQQWWLRLKGRELGLGKISRFNSATLPGTTAPSAASPPVPTLRPTAEQSAAALLPPTAKKDAPYVLGVVRVNANVRAGPGTQYNVVRGAKAGDTIEVYGQTVSGWLKLNPKEELWISASLVDLAGDGNALPILTYGDNLADGSRIEEIVSDPRFGDYRIGVITAMSAYFAGNERVSSLAKQAGANATLILDSDWRIEMASALAMFGVGGKILRDLDPPVALLPVHAKLLEAATDYDTAANLVADGLDTFDIPLLQQAATKMVSASEKLTQAGNILNQFVND